MQATARRRGAALSRRRHAAPGRRSFSGAKPKLPTDHRPCTRIHARLPCHSTCPALPSTRSCEPCRLRSPSRPAETRTDGQRASTGRGSTRRPQPCHLRGGLPPATAVASRRRRRCHACSPAPQPSTSHHSLSSSSASALTLSALRGPSPPAAPRSAARLGRHGRLGGRRRRWRGWQTRGCSTAPTSWTSAAASVGAVVWAGSHAPACSMRRRHGGACVVGSRGLRSPALGAAPWLPQATTRCAWLGGPRASWGATW